MRLIINALAFTALALPVGLYGQEAGEGPACRATLDGELLTTTIEFTNGYVVEAPWRVTANRTAALEDGRRGLVVDAVLDRIIETEPATGEQRTTPFPDPIEAIFEGHSEEELVYRAAQIWCLTIMELQKKAPASSSHDNIGRVRRS